MSIKIEMKIDNLVKKFNTMPIDVQNAMIDELKITALMIESGYKIGVPVDTGRLRSSIHVETANQRSYSYSDSTGQTYLGKLSIDRLQKTQVIIGTNVEYASKIEYRGGKTKGKQALLEAFEKETEGLPERLVKLIK